jgi:hypothetical protein
VRGRATDPETGLYFDALQIILNVSNTGATPAKWYEFSGELVVTAGDTSQVIKAIDIPVRRWSVLPNGSALTGPFSSERSVRVLKEASEAAGNTVTVKGLLRSKTEFDEVRAANFKFFCFTKSIRNYLSNRELGKHDPVRLTRPPEETTIE